MPNPKIPFGGRTAQWLLYALPYILCFIVVTFILAPTWGSYAPAFYDPPKQEEIDVVGIAVKPTCVTKRAIEGLNQHLNPRRIIVVTTTRAACVKFESFASNVICIIEISALPGVSKDAIKSFLEKHYGSYSMHFNGRDDPGWYLQQFLKLGAISYIPNLSEYHVIWDLDMIPLQTINIFHSSKGRKRTIINIGGSSSPGYDYSHRNLTGCETSRAYDGTSFVAHWMVVHNPFMMEYLNFLSSRPIFDGAPKGSPWVWAILSSLDPSDLHLSYSEYASFQSWVLQNHPDDVYVMSKKTWHRNPVGGPRIMNLARKFNKQGVCCPSDIMLAFTRAIGFQYTGYEIGHNTRCNYNDPKYAVGYGV